MNNELTDNYLITTVQNSTKTSSSCLNELIERHSGIYIEMVNNYVPDNSPLINKSDLIDDKNYYIYKAALKFNPEKGTKFSTYLGNETKWMCLNLYNKKKKNPEISYEHDCFDRSEFIEDQSEQRLNLDIFNQVIRMAEQHPDSRVSKIFKMRYIEGQKNKVMPWQKIGEDLQMSIQGCINIHNSALSVFRQKLIKE